jgi:glycosyltransferase involved in cell wall biosynthesis
MSRLKSWIGHRLREGLVLARYLTSSRSGKKIVFFPCGVFELCSSRDRAYLLGDRLRKLGWVVVVVPCQLELEQRRRILRIVEPDVLFIQKGRHPLNWPAMYEAPHKVFDIDDADFVDPKQHGQVVACCEGVDLVICGSRYVADFCRQYNPNTHTVWTGADAQRRNFPKPSTRRAIVAWGTSDANGYPAELEFLGEVMALVALKTKFEFWIYGVRDRDALSRKVEELRRRNVDVRLFPPQPFQEHLSSLEQVAVGVHPIGDSQPFSLGKSFGKLSSYLMSGVSIVVHRKLDYPEFFEDGVSGMLADEPAEWAEKIMRLLGDGSLRDRMVENARESFERDLNCSVAAAKVDGLLGSLVSADRSVSQPC